MIDELRRELDGAMAQLRDRLEVIGRLTVRKQRTLLRHVRALLGAAARGEEFDIAHQQRYLAIAALVKEADGLPPVAPAPPPKRLPRGRHLHAVD